MIALSLAIVIVGLAGIGAAWHVAIRTIARKTTVDLRAAQVVAEAGLIARIEAAEAALRTEIASVAEVASTALHDAGLAETLAKKAEERVRNRDVAEKIGGRS